MTSIMGVIAAVKTDSYHMLDATVIQQACRQQNYRWRDRLLNPVVTLRLFLLQILHGHTACHAVTHLSTLSFTAQAYCAARKRIPLRVYQSICRTLVQNMLEHTKDAADKVCWHGHRILCVDGSNESAWQSLPQSVKVRELRHRIHQAGYRTRCVTLVTTLLDDKLYTKHVLTDLYLQRWQIEVNLRHLKQTLGMNGLRSCTCEGITKEMIMFLMAYNLVRLMMLRSAMQQSVVPDRISFMDTMRWLCSDAACELIPNLLINTDRPGRYQPRVMKRAKDKYPRMTRPRKQYHAKHLKNIGFTA